MSTYKNLHFEKIKNKKFTSEKIKSLSMLIKSLSMLMLEVIYSIVNQSC